MDELNTEKSGRICDSKNWIRTVDTLRSCYSYFLSIYNFTGRSSANDVGTKRNRRADSFSEEKIWFRQASFGSVHTLFERPFDRFISQSKSRGLYVFIRKIYGIEIIFSRQYKHCCKIAVPARVVSEKR